MCGISGLANCGDKEILARMTSIQAQRGPDDSGLWELRFPDGSYFALGSRRLAILDLSPMATCPFRGPVCQRSQLSALLNEENHPRH